ncbi:MAG: DNA mismatch repair endonuclease MutL, partial [Candidatus Micrarchaeia archaeon]
MCEKVMGKILQLPKLVREKIAAGEVITAPVSVVKELIENSLDANASNITIEIERGGKILIRVIDDGDGMDVDDLKMCAKRFATSKISNETDLEKICTLGFRGEALASMAVVGELSIQSNGYAARYDELGEVVGEIQKGQLQKGTCVELRNLFGKMPVRLNFLKSDAIETSKITDLVKSYSLLYNHVSFRLVADKRELFRVNKESTEKRVFNVLGKEVHDNVIKLDHQTQDVIIDGFISKVGYSRKTRDFQFVFINGRIVKCDAVIEAIKKGYAEKLFLDRHPVVIIKLKINPLYIDVNVHPTKEELRFKNEYVISDAIIGSVRKAI